MEGFGTRCERPSDELLMKIDTTAIDDESHDY